MIKLILNTTIALAAVAIAAPASAQISGFGDGTGFTVNKSANAPAGAGAFSSGTLTLTTANNDLAVSVYSNTRQQYSLGFTASFTYLGTNGADGFVFVLHNDDINALGDSGGERGYTDSSGKAGSTSPVSPSVGIVTSIFGSDQIGKGVNGVQSELTGPGFDLTAGAINYTITYNPAVAADALNVSATNGTTTFNRSFTVGNPATVLGSPTAFVGFTGGTGGSTSNQQISNFSYTPVPEPSTLGLLGLTTIGVAALRRRRS
ncbi:MAG TPA: PEP-CTERM sorting domain-containing protein [Chthoniobacteraceae bacterium]|jgi:hypothetical protein